MGEHPHPCLQNGRQPLKQLFIICTRLMQLQARLLTGPWKGKINRMIGAKATGCWLQDCGPTSNMRKSAIWQGDPRSGPVKLLPSYSERSVPAEESWQVWKLQQLLRWSPVFTRIARYQWSSIVAWVLPMNCSSETHVGPARIVDGLTCLISMPKQVTQAQPCSSVGTYIYLSIYLSNYLSIYLSLTVYFYKYKYIYI